MTNRVEGEGELFRSILSDFIPTRPASCVQVTLNGLDLLSTPLSTFSDWGTMIIRPETVSYRIKRGTGFAVSHLFRLPSCAGRSKSRDTHL